MTSNPPSLPTTVGGQVNKDLPTAEALNLPRRDSFGLLHRGAGFKRANAVRGDHHAIELRFARRWELDNCPPVGLSGPLDSILRDNSQDEFPTKAARRPVPLDQNAATVAATVIQWLGTRAGLSMVVDVLAGAGYAVVNTESGRAEFVSQRHETQILDALKNTYQVDATPEFLADDTAGYRGTVNEIPITQVESTHQEAARRALQFVRSGAAIDALCILMHRGIIDYYSGDARLDVLVDRAGRAVSVGERMLADPDIKTTEFSRDRLAFLCGEWQKLIFPSARATAQARAGRT